MPCGLLLLDKPRGIRSSVCVAILRRRLGRTVKVGHGGTLDSTAQGLLVLLAGGATRASASSWTCPRPTAMIFRLGEERSAGIPQEGSLFRPCSSPSVPLIEKFLPSFYGTRLQTPPSISAIRIDGERAHHLARKGREVSLVPRPVKITSISLLPLPSGGDLIGLRIRCGKGTYVRSIVTDLGRLLGCGAHVLSLVRQSSGNLKLAEAVPFARLEDDSLPLEDSLLPLSLLAENFYSYRADEEVSGDIRNGKEIPLSKLTFHSEGIISPERGAVVLGEDLFSFGAILPQGVYRGQSNIFPLTDGAVP
ncbi:tRNA pseudouridine(55) synthase TruB [Aminivibrio sp.]